MQILILSRSAQTYQDYPLHQHGCWEILLSLRGEGTARLLIEDAERLHGLRVLMAHYTEERFAEADFLPRPLSLTAVVRVDVSAWTCKRLVRG